MTKKQKDQLYQEYVRDITKADAQMKEQIAKGVYPTYEQLLWWYSIAGYMQDDHIDDKNLIFGASGFAREWCDYLAKYEDEEDEFYRLWSNTCLFEAPHKFDSYMLYLEKDREYEERFYQPKRKCFQKLGIVQDLQDLEDGKYITMSLSLPPGVGKTTLAKFYMSWIFGRNPHDYNIFFSHSGDITRMFYNGVLDICTSSEYRYKSIFPTLKLISQNAKTEQINFNNYKPFPNLQTATKGGENAGKIRANHLLLCDDLIGSFEEALSKPRLDKLWGQYATDFKQRKVPGCKELHIATRWSVHDVIGRLSREYEGDERCKFVAFPDIDPVTKTSNFKYDCKGFDVDFFNDQAKTIDEVSYRCLYKNEPIEREGLLYTNANVRRYLNLPAGEPDEILAQCDTKGKGTDYMVMPIFYRYANDYYLVDVVCSNNADYEAQYSQLANILVRYKAQNCDFERNAGGDRVALEVNNRVLEAGYICNITDTPTESNKEARIFQCSNWIMQHIFFKDNSMYMPRSEYSDFMNMLLTYSVTGKNPHDDVCDVLSNFALRMQARERITKVEVFDRRSLGF